MMMLPNLRLAMWVFTTLLSLDSLSSRSLNELQPNHQILGKLSAEREVNVPASQAWELYGTLHLTNFIKENLPHVFQKAEVLQGDGGVGTILHLFFPPGTPGLTSYKEKFIKVDKEKGVKEANAIEGGYLDLGFTLYRVRVQIIRKGKESCIVRFTIEYKLKEEAIANASLVSIQPMIVIMEAANTYLLNSTHT